MPLVLVATPGAANANSFLTLAEATAYFEGRSTVQEWDDADSQEALLVMSTRVLTVALSGIRRFMLNSGMTPGYFVLWPKWTGLPSTTTQRLPWPRTGMFDRNGNAIAIDVVPQDLKDATAELAGILAKEDVTLDNAAIVQGIKEAHAGSVGVTFKDFGVDTSKFLADMVIAMLVQSWITKMAIEGALPFDFEVM